MEYERKTRCGWATSDAQYIAYHDEEWAVPVHQDTKLFEFLSLEGMQAGLSWLTILKRRQAYRELFDGFDPARVAQYDEVKSAALLTDARIIRNRLKIQSIISNARAFLRIQEQFGTFDSYIWQFADGKPLINCWQTLSDIPPRTVVSDAMSKALKQRGFSFVGSTICYAFMQACGLVNDHVRGCFLYPCG